MKGKAETDRRGRIGDLVPCILLLAAGTAAYQNSFAGAFVYDDRPNIVDNSGIRSFAAALRDGVPGLRHRPLARLSLALNYALGGLDVRGYHVFNLLVHLAGGLLLFHIVRRTLLLRPLRSTAEARWLALAVAILWTVHPLQTESVTYVTQRLEAMASLFYLACLCGVLRGAQSPRALAWYVGAIIACWLGMATKEIVVTAPLVVLLYDRVFLAQTWATLARRRWGLYAGLFLGLAALTYATRDTLHARADFPAGFGYHGITPWQYLSSQPGVILHYLRLTIWPTCLTIEYDWPVAHTSGEVVWPGIVVGSLWVASLVALIRWPPIGFLGLTFFLVLAPTSSVMQNAFLAVEHRMYLPLAPVITLGVVGLHALARRALPEAGMRRTLEGGALGLAALALTLRTIDRNREYRDAIAMWSSVVRCLPDSSRGHFNLGEVLAEAGRSDEAIMEFRRVLELQPGSADAHNNLAVILEARGNPEEGGAHYREAIKGAPGQAQFQTNYGNLLGRRGDCARAVSRFRKALRLDPSYAAAHLGLGLCLDQQADTAAAIAAFRRAATLDPDPRAGKELVRLLATAEPKDLRDPAEAVRLGEDLVARSTGADLESLLLLATAYAEAGRPEDAVATAQRAYDRAVARGDASGAREAAAALDRYRPGTPSHP
jgi:tetratricopeptide (TPR) repeat protein